MTWVAAVDDELVVLIDVLLAGHGLLDDDRIVEILKVIVIQHGSQGVIADLVGIVSQLIQVGLFECQQSA